MLTRQMLVDCQETYLRTTGLPFKTKLLLELAPADYRRIMPHHADYCIMLWPKFAIPRIQMAILNEGAFRFTVIEAGLDVMAGEFYDQTGVEA